MMIGHFLPLAWLSAPLMGRGAASTAREGIMDLSETARREVFERALVDSQSIADFILKRCNGRDEPYIVDDDLTVDSAIQYARDLKEACVDRLAKLRAGVPMSELRP